MSYNQRVLLSILVAVGVVGLLSALLLPEGTLIPAFRQNPGPPLLDRPDGGGDTTRASRPDSVDASVPEAPRTPAQPPEPPAGPEKVAEPRQPDTAVRPDTTPEALPEPDTLHVYRLPYGPDLAYRVIQGFDGTESHAGGIHAVDFAMPQGGTVTAVRSGGVVPIPVDLLTDTSTNPDLLRERRNSIAVEHEDGTVALYGNLDRTRAVVDLGQRVQAGQKIADLGKDAPHLHLEVLRPDDGRPRTFPFRFATRQSPGGQVLEKDGWYLTPASTVDIPLNAVGTVEAVNAYYQPQDEFRQFAPITVMVHFNLAGDFPLRIEFVRPNIESRIERPIEWHESRLVAWCSLERDDTRYHLGTWRAIAWLGDREVGAVDFDVVRGENRERF